MNLQLISKCLLQVVALPPLDDGKPIMAKDPSTDENLGEAKTMQIGDDGKPIESK